LGDIESALKEYEIFTAKNPTNAKGHLLKGDSNRVLGNLEAAKEEYQQAKMLLTNDLSADRRLANIILRLGDFEQAENDIKNYLKSSNIPEDEYFAWNEIAELYWLRGQRKEALSAFRNSFEALKRFSPETTYLLTRVQQSWRFATAGVPEEGKQMIEDANMLLKTSKGKLFEFNINISKALYDAHIGKTENAIRLINEVDESMSNYIGAGKDDIMTMLMGVIQFKSEAYVESADSLKLFLNHNPTNQIEMMAVMGESLFRSGQIHTAKTAYETILKEFPSHPLANYGMARVEINLEKPAVAKPYLEKAIKGWAKADESYEPANNARKLFSQLESI